MYLPNDILLKQSVTLVISALQFPAFVFVTLSLTWNYYKSPTDAPPTQTYAQGEGTQIHTHTVCSSVKSLWKHAFHFVLFILVIIHEGVDDWLCLLSSDVLFFLYLGKNFNPQCCLGPHILVTYSLEGICLMKIWT